MNIQDGQLVIPKKAHFANVQAQQITDRIEVCEVSSVLLFKKAEKIAATAVMPSLESAENADILQGGSMLNTLLTAETVVDLSVISKLTLAQVIIYIQSSTNTYFVY
jgi:hypothetical protein